MILANIFSDGVVLQQNQYINLWGYADSGDAIYVKMSKDSDKSNASNAKAIADADGFFSVELKPVSASFDTYTLECRCESEEVIVSDILFGEVWLASGQSNMIFGVAGCIGADELMDNADNSWIRFATAYPFPAGEDMNWNRDVYPSDSFPYYGWQKADSRNHVAGFSYVGYSFALKLFSKLNIPIGIICAAFGGTAIDVWLPRADIDGDDFLKGYLQSTSKYIEIGDMNRKGEINFTQMTVLYNERIAPLEKLCIKGLLWYQGESNIVGQFQEEETKFYRYALNTLFAGWKKRFGNPDLSIIVSHIAYFNYYFSPFGVAQINESMDDVCKEFGNSVMQIPVYDVPPDWKMLGNIYSDPIHPTDKAPIGERMALAALQNVYSVESCFAVPALESALKEGNRFIFTFKDVGEGLRLIHGSTLRGFTVCGEDGVHLEAVAIIKNVNTIEAYNSCIKEPMGATYAYSCINIESNLCSSYGIPAVPFRLNRKNETYRCPNPWMNCDSLSAWSDHTRWYMGGGEYKSIWEPGLISGTRDITISLDSEIKSEGDYSIKFEYEPNEDTGNFIGISPVVNLVGRHHQFNHFDYLTFDILSPDDREKTFAGLVMISSAGMIYSMGAELDGLYKDTFTIAKSDRFITYKVPLKKLYGSKMICEKNSRNTLENIVKIQWTFSDRENGTLYIDNISLGIES